MRAKKVLALTMIAGLVAGSAVTADAKKKKPKPKKKTVFVATPVDYYLGYPAEEGSNCTQAYISTTVGPADKPGCGQLIFGAPTEALITAGQDETNVQGLSAAKRRYAAKDGVPVILDAKKDITGTVIVGSYCCSGDGIQASGGAAKLEVAVVGDSGGEEKVIGETVVDYTAQPGTAPATVEYTLEIDDALDKAQFTTLTLMLRNRGVTVGHGFYSTGGDTLFTLPTYVKKTVTVKK